MANLTICIGSLAHVEQHRTWRCKTEPVTARGGIEIDTRWHCDRRWLHSKLISKINEPENVTTRRRVRNYFG